MNRIKIGTVTLAVLLAASSVSAREVIDFDAGWRLRSVTRRGLKVLGTGM